MGLETTDYIAGLVASNPTGADDYATADDHLRLLKHVLQSQFPNLEAEPINVSSDELNALAGFTGDSDDLNILSGASPQVTAAEFLYLANVTSDIQNQLNSKATGSALINAGNGLVGGGDLTGGATIHVGEGDGITVGIDTVLLNPAHTRNVDHAGVGVTAGAGLTGGGTINVNRTIDVGAGAGIQVNTDTVQLDTAHERNVDHTAINMLAGNGLTGGGTIDASRAFHIVPGDGLTVSVDSVQLNASHPANIDHSTVSMNTLADSGLAGGGTLLSDRNLRMDVNNLADYNAIPDRADFIPIYNGTTTVKVAMEDFNRIDSVAITADYTLLHANRNQIIRYTAGGTADITVPPNSTVNYELGTVIGAENYGTGTLNWLPGAGVTIRSPDNKLSHRTRYSQTVIRKIGTNEWILGGDVGA